MASTATSFHGTKVGWVISTCIVALVLSYVVFDLLDLDSSNFALRLSPYQEATLFVAETAVFSDSDCCRTDATFANQQSVEQEDGSAPSDHFTVTSSPLPSALWFLRAHGYRSGLARSSPPG